MIKGRSALESLQQFGIANDGPLNKGGIGVTVAKPVTYIEPSVTRNAPEERNAVTNADRQRAYRERKKGKA